MNNDTCDNDNVVPILYGYPTKDVEFSSPSLAAVAVCGGASNGLTAWKDSKGNSLGKLESG